MPHSSRRPRTPWETASGPTIRTAGSTRTNIGARTIAPLILAAAAGCVAGLANALGWMLDAPVLLPLVVDTSIQTAPNLARGEGGPGLGSGSVFVVK